MSELINLAIRFEGEAKLYDDKAKRATIASDKKKYRALSGIMKDVAASVKEAAVLDATLPVTNLIDKNLAERFLADAKDRGPGQAFRDSLAVYCREAVKMETGLFGGILFTKIFAEMLKRVNWTVIGEYIVSIAGAGGAEDAKIYPVSCECGVQSQVRAIRDTSDGLFYCRCACCDRKSAKRATEPQAIQQWNIERAEEEKTDA